MSNFESSTTSKVVCEIPAHGFGNDWYVMTMYVDSLKVNHGMPNLHYRHHKTPKIQKILTDAYQGSLLENGFQDCWNGCNKQEGKCAWCGTDGWCCRKDRVGNGCDGNIGGPNNHQCVLKTGMYS